MKKKITILIISLILNITMLPNIKATTKAPIDITTMNINELSEALDREIITSEQLVNIYLERIEKYDSNYNSINQINKNAINEAKELDEDRKKGKIKGKLHGIPIVVKTNIDVKGLATTAGAKALSDNYPNEDAAIIKKLKEEGAIILATTNMSEFAFLASSSASSYGTVKNAYNNNYSSYGSSGGTAVAVALSFAAAGIGTDTNSSIRVPSSANNLYGFRPSYGTVDMTGILPYDKYRDVVGPMTKNVIDNAIIMDVITNNNIYEQATQNSSLKGKRIGVIKEFYDGSIFASLKVNRNTFKGVVELMDKQFEKLEEAGAKIVFIDDFMNQTYYEIIFNTMSGFTFCDTFNNYIKNTSSKIKSFKELHNSNNKIYDLSRYYQSCNKSEEKYSETLKARKQKYLYYVGEVMEKNNVDVLLYPTVKNELQKINEVDEGTLITPSTYISSTTGLPAVNVPLGFYKNLPYGMEFLAGPNQETLLFEIISEYEKLNDTFTLPRKAPSLYQIDDSILKLTEEYIKLSETDISLLLKLKTNKIINQTKEYYKNYNNNTDEENINQSEILIEEIEEILKKDEKINNFYKKTLNIIIIIFILFITLLILKNKHKKNKRKKKKINNI